MTGVLADAMGENTNGLVCCRTAVPKTVSAPDWLLQQKLPQECGMKTGTKKARDRLRDNVRDNVRENSH